jgi:hypothetical protein
LVSNVIFTVLFLLKAAGLWNERPVVVNDILHNPA